MSTAPLLVGFDGRALASPAAGVRRYVWELFAAIGQLDAGVRSVAIGPGGSALPPRVVAAAAAATLPTNLGWNLVGVPLTLRRVRPDLYHAPAYTAPPWGVHPLVLTIHDPSYARHPEWYPYRQDAARRMFYRLSARGADMIITDSNFAKEEIMAAYETCPSKIRVIPLGVGAPFFPGSNEQAATRPQGPTPPYILHVGDLHPRRAVQTALRATLVVRQRSAALSALQLVLAGTDRGSLDELLREADRAGQPNAVRALGSVTDETLVALYRSAKALVYPSRYEGFGLPALEAMACGTPVIAARAGSLPELVGDAGLLVPADDVDGFADALEQVLTDEAFAAELRRRSWRKASEMTWRRAAEATVEVYRECVRTYPRSH